MNHWIILAVVVMGLGLSWILWTFLGDVVEISEPQDNYVSVLSGQWNIEEAGQIIRQEAFEWLRGERQGWWVLSATRNSEEDQGTQKLVLTPELVPQAMNLEIAATDGITFQTQALIDTKKREGKIISKTAFLPAFSRTFELTHAPAVVDVTFFSAYIVLYEMVKANLKSNPTLTALVPSRMNAWTLNFEHQGLAQLDMVSGPIAAEHIWLDMGDIQAEWWIQNEQLIGVRSGNRLAYRSDLFDSAFIPEPSATTEPPLPQAVSESDALFESHDGVNLAGSLVIPDAAEAPLPAVLFVPGAGPVDRNENTGGLLVNAFNTLAYALAEQGVVSLRYDKRGIGGSGGNPEDIGFVTHQLADAQAALDWLRQQPTIDAQRIVVVGHSEGALLSAMLVAENEVSGWVALTAPVVQPFAENWLWQTRLEAEALGLDDPETQRLIAQWQALFDFIAQSTGTWDNNPVEAVQQQFSNVNADHYQGLKRQPLAWWREILDHDPRATLLQINESVLFIQGDKDLSVRPDEGQRLKLLLSESGNARVEVHRLQNLNHFLRYHPEPADPISPPLHLNQPLDPRLVELVVEWILIQTR